MIKLSNSLPITLLIVDDDAPSRTLLGRLLGRYPDLDVIASAETGEEALVLAAERSPAVVIMDADMAGIGGIEATRRLVEAHPGVRVIG